MFDVCQVLAKTVALAVVFYSSSAALAAAPFAKTQAPGFYHMMLGDFEVTALNDGIVEFATSEVLPDAGSARSRLAFSMNFLYLRRALLISGRCSCRNSAGIVPQTAALYRKTCYS